MMTKMLAKVGDETRVIDCNVTYVDGWIQMKSVQTFDTRYPTGSKTHQRHFGLAAIEPETCIFPIYQSAKNITITRYGNNNSTERVIGWTK